MYSLKLLISTIILLVSPALTAKQNYIAEVNNAYSLYCLDEVTSDENENYQLVLVSGMCNDKLTYGVFFCDSLDKYDLYILKDENYHKLFVEDQNMIYALGINIEGDSQLILYSQQEDKKFTFSFPTFSESNALVGQNQGCQLTYVDNNGSPKLVLYIVLGSLIVIALTVLLILKLTHSGLFAPSRRKEGVFNMKEFIKNTEEYKEPYDPLRSVDNQEIIDNDKDSLEKENFSIKDYLIQKGYPFEYSSISEEEKNKVMLELMILKNTGKITERAYQEEVVKLWKK